jgi:uncharacterized protein (DUF302 family)
MMAFARRPIALAALLAVVAWSPAPAGAQAETETVVTAFTFDDLHFRLTQAIKANKMVVVTKACASCGAALRGVSIPGNMVLGVYRNDFAVRMLEASLPAGIEAPIRFYITDNGDGSTSLTYQVPSRVFEPYGSDKLDAMAQELDKIWQKIVEDTLTE